MIVSNYCKQWLQAIISSLARHNCKPWLSVVFLSLTFQIWTQFGEHSYFWLFFLILSKAKRPKFENLTWLDSIRHNYTQILWKQWIKLLLMWRCDMYLLDFWIFIKKFRMISTTKVLTTNNTRTEFTIKKKDLCLRQKYSESWNLFTEYEYGFAFWMHSTASKWRPFFIFSNFCPAVAGMKGWKTKTSSL